MPVASYDLREYCSSACPSYFTYDLRECQGSACTIYMTLGNIEVLLVRFIAHMTFGNTAGAFYFTVHICTSAHVLKRFCYVLQLCNHCNVPLYGADHWDCPCHLFPRVIPLWSGVLLHVANSICSGSQSRLPGGYTLFMVRRQVNIGIGEIWDCYCYNAIQTSSNMKTLSN